MAPERVLAILNPVAGRGAAERAWAAAGPVLRAAGVPVELVRTEAAGHATRLAAGAAPGDWKYVIAVGGDGTINEVANGLLGAAAPGRASVSLAVIPGGSGNDFIKPLGIPVDPATAAAHLLRASPRQVDAGRVAGTWFVNGVGVGFDAQVAMTARGIRMLRGTALYAWALLKVAATYTSPRVRVSLDDAAPADRCVTMISAANGPCCGGGFWLCPDARLDDGRLDVLIADAMPRRRVLAFLAASMRRAHLGRPGLEIHHARKIVITSDQPLPIHVDGQILAPMNRIEIEILPHRLTVLA